MKQLLYLLLLLLLQLPLLVTLYIQFLLTGQFFCTYSTDATACSWSWRSFGWEHRSCDHQPPASGQSCLLSYNFSISFVHKKY